jgi:hypothetical protein
MHRTVHLQGTSIYNKANRSRRSLHKSPFIPPQFVRGTLTHQSP